MSRSADPSSYRDRRSDSRFGGALGYGSSVCSSSSKRDYDVAEPPRKLDLDGLTPFEKNFYVESPSVAAMSEKEVEENRLQREITVEGRDVPKPVKSFSDVGFPEYVMQEIAKASTSAEILAIAKACEMLSSRPEFFGKPISIASDSMIAVDWVKNRGQTNSNHTQLIQSIFNFLDSLGQALVVYCPRKANSYADFLAKKGAAGSDEECWSV